MNLKECYQQQTLSNLKFYLKSTINMYNSYKDILNQDTKNRMLNDIKIIKEVIREKQQEVISK